MARTWLTTVLTGLLLLISSPQRGPAQVPLFPDEFERLDVIAIERDKRDLLGFDALTGSRSVFRLDVGETILFEQTRGRVGLVLTDRRALGIAPGAGFQAVRYSVHEDPPISALVDERIAIVVTPKRVLGFLESGPLWVEEAIPPSERVQALRPVDRAAVRARSRRRASASGTRLA